MLKHEPAEGSTSPVDDPEAAEFRQKMVSAEQGEAIAQFALAMDHFHGFGVPLDLEAALIWMERAANQNYVEAQFALGIWYEEGEGVEKDAISACMWYLLAASNGHAAALEHLGRFESSLTKEELKRAEGLANRWVEVHYE